MNSGIKNSWSFLTFIKAQGQPKLATFTNSQTGETFKALMFPDGEKVTTPEGKEQTLSVGFSSNLGELDAKELNAKRHELQIIQLESGTYKLCQTGSSWENISIILD